MALLRLASGPAERITIADLLAALGDRGLVVLILLFAIPNVLPMPPGTSSVLGTPLLFLTAQWALDREPWLPRAIAGRSLARASIAPAMRRVAAWLLHDRGWLRPRLQALVHPPAVRLIGVLSLLLAGIVFLPIPFGNMLPGLAISLFALGVLRRDGLWVLGGFLAAVAALGLLWGLAFAVGPAVVDWTLRLFG